MILLLLVVLGLVLGSFVNALVWRLHEGRDWVGGRSECSKCHHVLGPLDLIPVVSWLALRGRCRYCHKQIEDNPLVELSLPVLFVLSYLFWPLPFVGSGLTQFVFWIVFLVGFLALSVYDLRWFILPDKVVFTLAGLAAVQVVIVALQERDWRIVTGALLGVTVISGIFYVLFQLSKGTWIGGGDVKLGLALGMLAGGLLEAFLVLFMASILGMLIALPLILRGKANRKTQLPFGPLLIAGLIVTELFGMGIIDWYSGLLYG